MAKKLDLKSFVISKLRSASRKWPPLYEQLKKATVYVDVDIDAGIITVQETGEELLLKDFKEFRVKKSGRRKMIRCAKCKRLSFDKFWSKTLKGKWRRMSATALDHIDPVVPTSGWKSFDDFIDRLFNGKTQVLCHKCHSEKTKGENSERRRHK